MDRRDVNDAMLSQAQRIERLTLEVRRLNWWLRIAVCVLLVVLAATRYGALLWWVR